LLEELSLLENIYSLLDKYRDKYLLALSLLPCLDLGLINYCEELMKRITNFRSWRVKILMLEAYLIYHRDNKFQELLESILIELKEKLSIGNFKIYAFVIPYLLSRNNDFAHNALSNLIRFLDEKLINNDIDYLDFLEFWEIFMRYSLFFKVHITNLYEKIKKIFIKYGKIADFLEALSYYFRYSNVIMPPKEEVLKTYKELFSEIKYDDDSYVGFMGSYLLSYIKINETKGLELFRKIRDIYYKPVDSLNLYKSIKRIRSLAALLYALTSAKTEREFVENSHIILEQIGEYIKYFSWKIKDWRETGEVSLDDVDLFISEIKDIAEEELIGMKELSEDMSYYFDTILNLLEDAIETLCSNVFNLMLDKKDIINDQLLSKLEDIIVNSDIFPLSYKAYIYPYVWLLKIDNADSELMKKSISYITKFCNKFTKMDCNDLVELFGELIGKSYYFYRKNEILDLFLDLFNNKKYFKQNKSLLKGFISGLYGLSSINLYKKLSAN